MFRRPFLLLLFALLGAALPGCQTGGDFPQPTAKWETYQGQMHYTSGHSSVVGEVVVRRLGPDFQLDFSSGPGFPLLRLRVSGTREHAEGVLARQPWRGWLKLAPAFAQAKPQSPVVTGLDFHAQATFQGGALEHLEVLNTATGEHFTFHFSR